MDFDWHEMIKHCIINGRMLEKNDDIIAKINVYENSSGLGRTKTCIEQYAKTKQNKNRKMKT